MVKETKAPKAFHCDKCTKAFRSEDALLAHTSATHRIHCEPCNRFFKCQQSLQQHQEDSPAHTTLRKKPQGSAHRTTTAWSASSAHVRPPAEHQRLDLPVQAFQHAQATQPPPEAVALANHLTRRIAALQQQLLALQTGQPAFHPTLINGTTYATTPALRTAQPPIPILPLATKPQPSQATTTAKITPTPTHLTHRGITYTTLTPAQQTTLHPLLLAHCHTRKRLTIEGYDLTPHPPTTIAPPPRHPHNDSNNNPRRHAAAAAVVLDCEMAGTSAGDYPIAVSMVDFFSGEVLVDALVRPAEGVVVRDWRSGITGITAARMAGAGRVGSGDGEPLAGREGARERVLGFVDGETVVVGQSVKFDLKALGIVHGRVVDSAVVPAEASGLFGGVAGGGGVHWKIKRWAGLEELCRELLGVRIRGEGGRSHDSLEDVLATRELVLWCLGNPDQLKAWAAMRWRVKAKKGWRVPQGKKGDSGRNKRGRTQPARTYRRDSDEMLRWEDVVDYECWPKSPPDWSD